MEQFALEFNLAPERRIYTVNELNTAIRGVLGAEFSDIWVSGEISGLKLAPSGHFYFTLKERDAQVRCVAFRSAHRYWKFKPQDGMAVLARGRIDVYEVRGEYQLQVETIEPQGLGALQVAFEQLKKKLAAEGLFAPERKRPLPRFPRRIGIVTSPRGAAIADMIEVLSRRFPGLHIRLFPALVQGEGSVEEICRGIEHFSRTQWPDLVIVGRAEIAPTMVLPVEYPDELAVDCMQLFSRMLRFVRSRPILRRKVPMENDRMQAVIATPNPHPVFRPT